MHLLWCSALDGFISYQTNTGILKGSRVYALELSASIVLFSNVHTNDFFLQKPENTTSQPPSKQQVVGGGDSSCRDIYDWVKGGGYDDEVPSL